MESDAKRENNYAFIDSQNLNLAILEQGWKLDMRRFRVYLRDKYHVQKAFMFLGFVAGNQDLYNSIQDYGYIIVFKPTLALPDGRIKGNVDAELVLHAMIEFANYDQAVIVTGDGDFYCLVDYFQKKGKLKRLLIPNTRSYSVFLKKFAVDHIDFISNLRRKLEFKKI